MPDLQRAPSVSSSISLLPFQKRSEMPIAGLTLLLEGLAQVLMDEIAEADFVLALFCFEHRLDVEMVLAFRGVDTNGFG